MARSAFDRDGREATREIGDTKTTERRYNVSSLRRICLNLLKPDTTTKAGIKNRRLKAGASDACRTAVLRL